MPQFPSVSAIPSRLYHGPITSTAEEGRRRETIPRCLLSFTEHRTVEDLSSLPEYYTLAGELFGDHGCGHTGDLLTTQLHPPLLHQAAGLLPGGHQATFEHQLQRPDRPASQIVDVQGDDGHVGSVASLGEQGLSRVLGLLCLLLAVNQLGRLKS